MSKREPVRCGICDVRITGSWKDHAETDEHKRLVQIFVPRVPIATHSECVKYISKASQKENRLKSKVAKAENLGYYSVANGRSFYRLRCECGKVSDVFVWRGCKRCSNCKKILHTSLSFREE